MDGREARPLTVSLPEGHIVFRRDANEFPTKIALEWETQDGGEVSAGPISFHLPPGVEVAATILHGYPWRATIDENANDLIISLTDPCAAASETILDIELAFSSAEGIEIRFIEVQLLECIPRTP